MVVDGVKVFVGVALIGATGQTMGKVEFNPSRIVAVQPDVDFTAPHGRDGRS